jgi:hypothetical protein
MLLSGSATLLSAPNVNTAGQTSEPITIQYNDPAGIRFPSLGDGNLQFTGGILASQLAVSGFHVIAVTPTSATVRYDVAAPLSGFEFPDNGPEFFALANGQNQVRDRHGVAINALSPSPAAFRIVIKPESPDPTATLLSPPFVTTQGQASEPITIKFSDPARINLSTLSDGNLIFVGGTLASQLKVGNFNIIGLTATSATVRYNVVPPAGGFSYTYNGAELFNLSQTQNLVRDRQGVPFKLLLPLPDAFEISIEPPIPNPVATLLTAPDVTTSGQASEPLTIQFTDPAGIDLSSLVAGNLQFNVGTIASQLMVSSLQVTASNLTSATVVYNVAAPAGGFTFDDNGAELFSLSSGPTQVVDGEGVPFSTLNPSPIFHIDIAPPNGG